MIEISKIIIAVWPGDSEKEEVVIEEEEDVQKIRKETKKGRKER